MKVPTKFAAQSLRLFAAALVTGALTLANPGAGHAAVGPVGHLPIGIGITPDGGTLYVANAEQTTVSVVNTSTLQPAHAPIDIQALSPFEVAISPDGSRAYVTASAGSEVVVIDTSTNTKLTQYSTHGSYPSGIAVTSDGQYLFITNSEFNSPSGTLVILRASDGVKVGGPITVGYVPERVALTPDGAFAYVTNTLDDTVSVVNTATRAVVGSPIAVGDGPYGIAVARDGSKVYVSNSNANTLSVISTVTNKVVGSPIVVGNGPVDMSLSPNGSQLFVANSKSNTVSVVRVADNKVVGGPIPVGKAPYDIAVSPNGATGYVTNSGDNTVQSFTAPPNYLPQTAANGCVTAPSGSRLSANRSTRLAKANCRTAQTKKKVGVRIRANNRGTQRGDVVTRMPTLRCKTSAGRLSKPHKLSYGYWCSKAQGSLVVTQVSKNQRIRVTWSAPGTSVYSPYVKTRTYTT